MQMREFDVHAVREAFPALRQRVYDQPLVYLDNAATTQKPNCVIDAIADFYLADCANVHRGAHLLSSRASAAYERARCTVAAFVGARPEEVIFAKGSTDAINLVCSALVRRGLWEGDEIIVSALEHHSNFLPWQRACAESGARLRVVPLLPNGELDLRVYEDMLSDRTSLVALSHASNLLGTINPIREMVGRARRTNALVLIDGAQAVPHVPVDIEDLGCDFYAFSAHKIYGPFGIGALFARREHFQWMAPHIVGGGMVHSVRADETPIYASGPARFEGGTPNVSAAVGFGSALDYFSQFDPRDLARHELTLAARATQGLERVPGVEVLGAAQARVPIVSFTLEGVHPHDLATVLDGSGVAVRAGHHCAEPALHQLGLTAVVRASFGIYNTEEDVDALTEGVRSRSRSFLDERTRRPLSS